MALMQLLCSIFTPSHKESLSPLLFSPSCLVFAEPVSLVIWTILGSKRSEEQDNTQLDQEILGWILSTFHSAWLLTEGSWTTGKIMAEDMPSPSIGPCVPSMVVGYPTTYSGLFGIKQNPGLFCQVSDPVE
ncbi:UNVERIFIED_CONTAM: hypothetical protein K2H54_020101 [Gekko kuhli]